MAETSGMDWLIVQVFTSVNHLSESSKKKIQTLPNKCMYILELIWKKNEMTI